MRSSVQVVTGPLHSTPPHSELAAYLLYLLAGWLAGWLGWACWLGLGGREAAGPCPGGGSSAAAPVQCLPGTTSGHSPSEVTTSSSTSSTSQTSTTSVSTRTRSDCKEGKVCSCGLTVAGWAVAGCVSCLAAPGRQQEATVPVTTSVKMKVHLASNTARLEQWTLEHNDLTFISQQGRDVIRPEREGGSVAALLGRAVSCESRKDKWVLGDSQCQCGARYCSTKEKLSVGLFTFQLLTRIQYYNTLAGGLSCPLLCLS